MKKQIDFPKQLPRRQAQQRAEQFLVEIQKELTPDQAAQLVAINLETGEYVLGKEGEVLEVSRAFRKRFPDQLPYVVRVDGGPVTKFHGM